ncbi:internal alternative NAD(P)H-ubiquinone oxidoreductase A1, mitochondrial-like [Apium graveolens]|uniref:internal alternative NAD(P)H-ubiquinone oxidoreductase A1, mitochondrial-like n=1 Tax=Apium graveolens TaxID=4045 RepID=UPI003D7BF015
MVFTPLLASTCVETLEFWSVTEPVTRIQSALAKNPKSYFYLAICTDVDTDKHEVLCETAADVGLPDKLYRFKVLYHKLVIDAGSEPLTLGIKGVKEHAYFLCEVNNAQEIRKKLLLNLMLSQNPGDGIAQASHPTQMKWNLYLPKAFNPLLLQKHRQNLQKATKEVNDVKAVSKDEVSFLIRGDDPYDDNVVLRNLYHSNLNLLLVTEGYEGCRYYTKEFKGRVSGLKVKVWTQLVQVMLLLVRY